jgi:hypothetical protein
MGPLYGVLEKVAISTRNGDVKGSFQATCKKVRDGLADHPCLS